jgi:hypothetical protein
VAAAHVAALTATGRYEEAATLGRQYYATARREELTPPLRCMVKPIAEAFVRAGHLDEAQALCDQALEELEADGVRGLWLGLLYEARASIAIARGDESAFEREAARCAAEYRRGKNSTLIANYERLMREAARRALRVPENLARAAERGTGTTTTRHQLGRAWDSVSMRLVACKDRSERAQCVLATLMEHSGADTGYFYFIRGGLPERVAAIPSDGVVPAELDAFIAEYLRSRTESSDVTRSLFDGETMVEDSAEPSKIETEAGVLFPVVLSTYRDGEIDVVALAILKLTTGSKPLNEGLVDAVVRFLVERGDVYLP